MIVILEFRCCAGSRNGVRLRAVHGALHHKRRGISVEIFVFAFVGDTGKNQSALLSITRGFCCIIFT